MKNRTGLCSNEKPSRTDEVRFLMSVALSLALSSHFPHSVISFLSLSYLFFCKSSHPFFRSAISFHPTIYPFPSRHHILSFPSPHPSFRAIISFPSLCHFITFDDLLFSSLSGHLSNLWFCTFLRFEMLKNCVRKNGGNRNAKSQVLVVFAEFYFTFLRASDVLLKNILCFG